VLLCCSSAAARCCCVFAPPSFLKWRAGVCVWVTASVRLATFVGGDFLTDLLDATAACCRECRAVTARVAKVMFPWNHTTSQRQTPASTVSGSAQLSVCTEAGRVPLSDKVAGAFDDNCNASVISVPSILYYQFDGFIYAIDSMGFAPLHTGEGATSRREKSLTTSPSIRDMRNICMANAGRRGREMSSCSTYPATIGNDASAALLTRKEAG